ncbi:unnamed protein product [Urochloa humidicola]
MRKVFERSGTTNQQDINCIWTTGRAVDECDQLSFFSSSCSPKTIFPSWKNKVLMASRPPPPSSFYSSLQGFFTLFAARSPRRDGCPADAFPSARHEDPNQRTVRISKTCAAGLQQESRADETSQQDSPSPDGRSVVPCFILDSGAACHVAGDKSFFSSPLRLATATPAGSAATYQARDGRQLAVAGFGTIDWGSFHLSDVLYVPDLPAGVMLVSVPKLTQHGYLVGFGAGQCYVQEQGSGKIVGKGRLLEEDALYHLEFLKISSDTSAP